MKEQRDDAWWNAGDDECDGLQYIEIMQGKCPSPECITVCHVIGNGHKGELTDADRQRASVIKNAPMLLEMLRRAAVFVDCNSEPWYKTGQSLLADIRAAIALAEGKI